MTEKNIYLELTDLFNKDKTRAIITSGQAVVLHHLAIMSKDGDWILKEDSETVNHILSVLSRYNARYRFGAPLDVRWMAGGWSAHFEFHAEDLRIRTDFFTRPPRISELELKAIWKEQEGRETPFVNLRHLAEIKKTNREKDYAVIGEIARIMQNAGDQLLYSRSALDLMTIADRYPDLVSKLQAQRPLLKKISEGRELLEEALDAERRSLMHANEDRLRKYMMAAEKWLSIWHDVAKETAGLSLIRAHEIVVKRAENVLPFSALED